MLQYQCAMLVVSPPIFVADTKIIYGYKLGAPLKEIHNFTIFGLLEKTDSSTLKNAM